MSFDDSTQWGQDDGAQEMGAQVIPGPITYRYSCSCGNVGQGHSTIDEANADGIQHELSMHPRVFTIQQLGT